MQEGVNVVGYARVSTTEQADGGNGLAAQEEAIRQACAARGWVLSRVARDEGLSGGSLDRPGLRGALGDVADRRVAGLVVAKLDRLSRSVVDFATLLDWFEEAEATLVALDLGIDTSSPGGRLVANVFASVAEWERAQTSVRTKEGLAVLRVEGRPISRPALADKPEILKRIEALRAEGKTFQSICDTLNAEGVPTLRGAAAWRPSALARSLSGPRRARKRRPVDLPPVARRGRRSRRAQVPDHE